MEDAHNIDQPLVRISKTGTYKYNNAPHHYRRFGFSKEIDWKIYPDRTVYANHPDLDLCDNSISTSKYSVITFLPLNLWEQFTKLANFYFLVIGFLQMVHIISTSGGKPVMFVPLSFIITVSAIKDLFEDWKRHQEDNTENNKKTLKYIGGKFVEVRWQSLRVGDIIKVRNEEFIPADLVILQTDSDKGECFTETKNLDGETNLKRKFAPKELKQVFTDDNSFGNVQTKVHYEKPTPFLYKFQGTLTVENMEIPIDTNNFLLRSSSLRSKWATGIVVYTGHETKIMLNSVKARPKRSTLEMKMQKRIIIVFLIQIILCIFCAVYSTVWAYGQNKRMDVYLKASHDRTMRYPFLLFLAKFGNWMLLFANFVPISLMVTLEVVKFLQAKQIVMDRKMINLETQTNVAVHSSNLNEELGQVEYIFSDKTGTLTCNIMAFKYLNVKGKTYGGSLGSLDISTRPAVTNVDFTDETFFEAMRDSSDPLQRDLHENILLLGLCHTIQLEEKNGNLCYTASSPDELAFVNFAKFAGYEFVNIDANQNMVLKVEGGAELRYKQLAVLEFNSTRKRMSVIIEGNDGQIILLSKGADNVMMERRSQDNDPEMIESINKELNVFSSMGLRTLVLAKRELSRSEFEAWIEEYKRASLEMVDREEKMMEVQEKIEKDLIIIGATAIEDKLQDEVGETIEVLKQAGIRLWVLTGDKVGTAINIAYSCRLLDDSLKRFTIDGIHHEEVLKQLKAALGERKEDEHYGIVITGDALIHAAEGESAPILFDVCSKASVVVACRVSPKQKSLMVNLVKDHLPGKTTLAIGDGANDVNMITAAHIGVGIKGLEGQQAARASDYAIGEFKLLRRLILFYGRECIRRNSVLVLYNFFKNLLLVFPAFWFAFFNGFSGQILYDPLIFQFYNIAYASFPIMIYALFDKEYLGSYLEVHPEYYLAGPKNEHFNYERFWRWFFSAFVQSFFVPVFAFLTLETSAVNEEGLTGGFMSAGMLAFTMLIIVANVKILIFSTSYNFLMLFFVFGSIAFYLLSFWQINLLPYDKNVFGLAQVIYGSPGSYFATILTVICSNGFDLAFRNLKNLQRRDKWDKRAFKRTKSSYLKQISSIELRPYPSSKKSSVKPESGH